MVGRTRKRLLALAPPAAAAADSALRVGELETEHAHNPRGIDATHPRLGWTLASPECAHRQSAYQIVVALTGLRLDPMTTQGDIRIDAIRILPGGAA